jgi:type I restriction enzyme S subunit
LKDSGVEDIGQIPRHWGTRKLGTLGVFFKGRGIAKSDITESGVPAITYGDIYTRYGVEAKALEKFIPSEVALNAQEIRAGDLLFTGSGETIEDIGKTTLYSGDVPGYAGGDVIVLRTRQGDALFLSYALNSDVGTRQKSAFGRGDIIVHISAGNLKQVVLPFPPEDEARKIARFLDHKTALIDDLIAKRERQIDLLQEHRMALITRAVTKGLNQDVPMKDSGVEWLGKVPEHWEVMPLGRVYCLQGGFAYKSEYFCTDGISIVRMSNLKNGHLDFSDTARVPLHLIEHVFMLNPGDLLVGMSGSLSNYAVVCEKDIPCLLNQRVGRFFLRSQGIGYYPLLVYLVQSHHFIQQVGLAASGTAQQNISSRNVEKIINPFPPLHEQHAIASFLDRETAKIDTFVAKVQQSIEKLRDYRQSLISAAVTGKINVCNWQSSSEPAEETLNA